MRSLLFLAIVVALVVRYDWWNQYATASWLGLPIALTYHLIYCVAASALLWALVRFAWPARSGPESDLGTTADGPTEDRA
ncbi:MAG: hypothetical protein AAGN46_09315 [Acidobacteriota bacterium]